MAHTYLDDPAASDTAMVRYLSGDTIDHGDYSASDAEIAATLTRVSDNTTLAAIEICEALAARCASLTDSSNAGGLSIRASQRSAQYAATAKRLRLNSSRQAMFTCAPKVPAKDTSFVDARDNATGEVQPLFKLGMNDNPGAGGSVDDDD